MFDVTLAALGPLEIGLIVVAILLVFGAGRLAGVGKALGTGIREFRQEARKPIDDPEESEDDSSSSSSSN